MRENLKFKLEEWRYMFHACPRAAWEPSGGLR